MEKNFYDDNNFQNLLNDLKNLPKVETTNDFEFKLMARIKNGNFHSETQNSEFTLSKFLKPAYTLATVLLLFFVFTLVNQDNSYENFNHPKMKNSKIGSVSNSQQNIKKENSIANSIDNSIETQYKQDKQEVANQNKKSLNFSGRTIDIDNELKQNSSGFPANERGVLAGSKEFDGFGLGIPVKSKEIDSMKQKIDSIRNSQKK